MWGTSNLHNTTSTINLQQQVSPSPTPAAWWRSYSRPMCLLKISSSANWPLGSGWTSPCASWCHWRRPTHPPHCQCTANWWETGISGAPRFFGPPCTSVIKLLHCRSLRLTTLAKSFLDYCDSDYFEAFSESISKKHMQFSIKTQQWSFSTKYSQHLFLSELLLSSHP